MNKKIIVTILLVIPMFIVRAQDNDNMGLARQVFEFVRNGDGESIIGMSNEEVRKQITAEVFSNIFTQLESQFGSYQSITEWNTQTVGDITVYYADIQFAEKPLRFNLVFDGDNKINGLTFVPVPEAKVEAQVVNNDKYKEQPIEVITDNYKLPGILTLPVGIKNPPVVILVHGSGAHDRDETIGPNKPFRELAWGLAERGIAVIRYDKRTLVYGQSFAPEGKMDMDEETVKDALSAVNLAATHKDLTGSDIYILGHSQGALLAPRMAERESRLAGIIMIAGNARPFEDLLVEQYEYLSTFPGNGLDEKVVEEVKAQAANVKKLGTADFDESVALPLIDIKSYWAYLNNYNQTETARNLNLPVFIIQGERDYQVTMEDFNLWQKALEGKKNASFKSYPALNHSLYEGKGKATPMEYGIEGKIPAYVMNDIADWILKGK